MNDPVPDTNPEPASSRVPPEAVPSQGLLSVVGGLIKTARPHQWVKNVFVLAPIVFAKEIFDPDLLRRTIGAFFVFCLLASAVYTMNDLVDADSDRVHPVKRFRPIAAGTVPRNAAIAFAALAVVLGIGGAATGSVAFLMAASIYFIQNVAYSFGLKKVPYLDVSMISAGFVLRVLAGGYATKIDVSHYLLACTALLALFLGFGKRRHELAGGEGSGKQRAALKAYTLPGLDLALGITAAATVLCYVVYTLDARTRSFFHSDDLWMTTGFVVLALWRFLFIVRSRPDAESPTQEILKDSPFVTIVLLWVVVIVWMVYNLRPGA
jgi:decaprenyl-phosphate phosphoribosyltransferase